MANQQSKRECKTGLCPNCHKFGETCTCGYNYGFATGAEFRKYKTQQEQNKKYQGIIKTAPVKISDIIINLQVVSFGMVCFVTEIQEESVTLKDSSNHYLRTPVLKTNLKTLVVEYDETTKHNFYVEGEGFTNTYKVLLPLKYSQWQTALETGEVNSNKTIEFQIKISAFDAEHNKIQYAIEPGDYTKSIAKIIPEKQKLYTEEEISKHYLPAANVSIQQFTLKNEQIKELEKALEITKSSAHKLIDEKSELLKKCEEVIAERNQALDLLDFLYQRNEMPKEIMVQYENLLSSQKNKKIESNKENGAALVLLRWILTRLNKELYPEIHHEVNLFFSLLNKSEDEINNIMMEGNQK